MAPRILGKCAPLLYTIFRESLPLTELFLWVHTISLQDIYHFPYQVTVKAPKHTNVWYENLRLLDFFGYLEALS